MSLLLEQEQLAGLVRDFIHGSFLQRDLATDAVLIERCQIEVVLRKGTNVIQLRADLSLKRVLFGRELNHDGVSGAVSCSRCGGLGCYLCQLLSKAPQERQISAARSDG